MTTPQTKAESQVIELSTEAFTAFCDDISGMFDVEMQCEQKEVATETIKGLKKRFKNLTAINVVDGKGTLQGTFQLVFDQEGLFTLGGVIVMLPEKSIMANRKDATADLAKSMIDAVGEAGNLLVGSWDRVFRKGLDGHHHFIQRLPAFVGKPWDNPKEKIGLSGDEELIYIHYNMTIGSFPTFHCGVIFPKKIFNDPSVSTPEQAQPTKEKAEEEKKEETQNSESSTAKTDSEKADAVQESDQTESKPQQTSDTETTDEKVVDEENKEGKTTGDNIDSPESSEPVEEVSTAAEENKEEKATVDNTDSPEPAKPVEEASTADKKATDITDNKKAVPQTSDESNPGQVSKTIQKMTKSPAVLPGESSKPMMKKRSSPASSDELLQTRAEDIMQKEIVWADPDESVQQVLDKMQQHEVGYVIAGRNGALEGIVSKSDLTAVISPYLRPIFTKWRRPSDDATLQIKIKWIMSRPVRTIGSETSLEKIMENMSRFGGRALPVINEQGKVLGLVTVFDIFRIMLNSSTNTTTAGKALESPPLV